MDANTLAKSIVDQATGEKPLKKPKSAAAIARGKARMASMTAEEISKNAANAAKKNAGLLLKAALRWKPESEYSS